MALLEIPQCSSPRTFSQTDASGMETAPFKGCESFLSLHLQKIQGTTQPKGKRYVFLNALN